MCNVIQSLVLERITPSYPPPPQAGSRATNHKMAAKDPDVLEGLAEDQTAEEFEEPHRVINPNEATIHVHSLDEALILMEARIIAGKEKDIMRDTIT